MRVAGVMSGTSLDGIDVAIVEIRGRSIETIGFRSTPYPVATRAALLRELHVAQISRLNVYLAELYARAVQAAVARFGPVELIGCHGQTIFHEGGSNSLQIGEAAVVAEETGVPVVSNFRARDIAAGGEGAPLVPFVDFLLFRHQTRNRVALNIGGIANVTVIPAGANPAEVVAFDTGPGNMVIDGLARLLSGGSRQLDEGGTWLGSSLTGAKNSTAMGDWRPAGRSIWNCCESCCAIPTIAGRRPKAAAASSLARRLWRGSSEPAFRFRTCWLRPRR